MSLPQALTAAECLPCQVCCRFPERDSPYRPCFTPAEIDVIAGTRPEVDHIFGTTLTERAAAGAGTQVEAVVHESGGGHRCPFLIEATGSCELHPGHPLDCQLYPLMLAVSDAGDEIVLHLDAHCPSLGKLDAGHIQAVADRVEANADEISRAPNLVADHLPCVRRVASLPRLSVASGLSDGVRRLRLVDRAVIEAACERGREADPEARQPLQFARGFVPIYLHRERHALTWLEAGSHIIVMAATNGAPWLPVAPLGGALDRGVLIHLENEISRRGGGQTIHLPSVRETDRPALEAEGYEVREEGVRVLADRTELVELNGRRFHSHRKLLRQARDSGLEVRESRSEDLQGILAVWDRWYESRASGRGGPIAGRMAVEGHAMLRRAFHERESLGVISRVVERDGRIEGFTAGVMIDEQSLVVLFEFGDPQLRGIGVLLAHELASAAVDATVLDLMDTHGLETVAWTKSRWGRQEAVLGALRLGANSPGSTSLEGIPTA